MKLEDVLEWVEIDLFEEFWWFFVPHMLNKMLEVVDFKKGMMEYAGMVKFSISKNKKIDLNKAKETQVCRMIISSDNLLLLFRISQYLHFF